jgi:hypothetical protein
VRAALAQGRLDASFEKYSRKINTQRWILASILLAVGCKSCLIIIQFVFTIPYITTSC